MAQRQRITVSLNDDVFDLLSTWARLQKRSQSSVAGELLSIATDPLKTLIKTLERAEKAPDRLKKELSETISELANDMNVEIAEFQHELLDPKKH